MLNNGSINENKTSFSHIPDERSVCKLGKSKVLPFSSKSTMASNCFDIIHSDVWGITPVISHTNIKYFVTFIDDHSRFTWVYLLHSKSKAFDDFQKFMAYVDNQFSTRIKVFRSDSGGEYMSHQFQTYLQKHGILSQRSCPYTSQQNGVAERKNRRLLNTVCSLFLESSVPAKFWPEAVATTVH